MTRYQMNDTVTIAELEREIRGLKASGYSKEEAAQRVNQWLSQGIYDVSAEEAHLAFAMVYGANLPPDATRQAIYNYSQKLRPSSRQFTKAELESAMQVIRQAASGTDEQYVNAIVRAAWHNQRLPKPKEEIRLSRGRNWNAKKAKKVHEWIWPDRFPIGGLSALAGAKSVGKSTLTFFMAAKVSAGGDWPGGLSPRAGRDRAGSLDRNA